MPAPVYFEDLLQFVTPETIAHILADLCHYLPPQGAVATDAEFVRHACEAIRNVRQSCLTTQDNLDLIDEFTLAIKARKPLTIAQADNVLRWAIYERNQP